MWIILGGATDDDDDGPSEREEEELFVCVFLLELVAEEVAEQGSGRGLFGAVGSEFDTLLATCTHHVMPMCNLE